MALDVALSLADVFLTFFAPASTASTDDDDDDDDAGGGITAVFFPGGRPLFRGPVASQRPNRLRDVLTRF